MGNEGGIGPNIKSLRDSILSIDNTRLAFYDSDMRYSDLFDFGYPSPKVFERIGKGIKDKPVIAREYAHCWQLGLG